MQARMSPFILKLMPSLADLAFVTPVVLLFGLRNGAASLLGNGDTGWHIRAGQWIVENHAVPARDIFSFSKAGDPWFAWTWLSDVVYAWLNANGGLRSVVLFNVLLLAAISVALYRLVRSQSDSVTAIFVTAIAGITSSTYWLARPHLFTLLFVAIFYVVLERIRRGETRLCGIPCLAILPVATILWTNLHSGFYAGILMICAYAAGEFLETVLTANGSGKAGWMRGGRYLAGAAGCLVASLANPYFYRLHTHMLAYLKNSYTNQHVLEYLSPNFHRPTAIFFEGLLVLAAAAAYWDLTRGRFTSPILTVMWAHAALLANRDVPVFAILAALPVARAIHEWMQVLPASALASWLRHLAARFNALAASTDTRESTGHWHLASAAAVAMLAVLLWTPNAPAAFRAEFDPSRYPLAALATLRNDPSARIFTDDAWGDYLIWSLYPTQKVFVDGRDDFYGTDFEQHIIDVLHVQHGWEKTLGRFGVNTILVPPKTPLAGVLKESSHWRVVFDDGQALVFRAVSMTRFVAAKGAA